MASTDAAAAAAAVAAVAEVSTVAGKYARRRRCSVTDGGSD